MPARAIELDTVSGSAAAYEYANGVLTHDISCSVSLEAVLFEVFCLLNEDVQLFRSSNFCKTVLLPGRVYGTAIMGLYSPALLCLSSQLSAVPFNLLVPSFCWDTMCCAAPKDISGRVVWLKDDSILFAGQIG